MTIYCDSAKKFCFMKTKLWYLISMLRSADEGSSEIKFLDAGLELFKSGGLLAVSIERLSAKSGLPASEFEECFKDKIDFFCKVYFYNMDRAKACFPEFLDENGRMSTESLRKYLSHIAVEYPNILAYIEDKDVLKETEERIYRMGGSEEKDAMKIIPYLEKPKEKPDIKLFCRSMRFASIIATNKSFNNDEMSMNGVGYIAFKAARYICSDLGPIPNNHRRK